MFWTRTKRTVIEADSDEGLAKILKAREEAAAPKAPKRQLAMAEYTLDFDTFGGMGTEHNRAEWQDWPQRHMHPSQRPLSFEGLRYKEGKKFVFIPWHQVKKASLTEILLWDDGMD